MKRIVYLCVILLCSISFAFTQKSNSKTGVKKQAVGSQFAEAEKAWIPFLRDFTKAVKSHDKDSLKQMISKNYRCYENVADECSCEYYTD